jgi:MoxR-like ATPase
LGLSPRGLLQWQRTAQARAMLQGRDFMIPEDVQDVAIPVLSVRLTGVVGDVENAIDLVLNSVSVPIL